MSQDFYTHTCGKNAMLFMISSLQAAKLTSLFPLLLVFLCNLPIVGMSSASLPIQALKLPKRWATVIYSVPYKNSLFIISFYTWYMSTNETNLGSVTPDCHVSLQRAEVCSGILQSGTDKESSSTKLMFLLHYTRK